MNMDTQMSGSTVKNHISLKTVFGYSATRRTSFRSWFLVCQRVLPQACLLQHPWHLQSMKLIIPRLPQARLPHQPMTSSTVSSESVARQERGDSCGIDHYPAIVSKGKNGETRTLLQKSCWLNQQKTKNQIKKRITNRYGKPVLLRNTGMAARIQRESCGWQSSWTQRLTRQFFSWSLFRADYKETWGSG